MSNAPKFENTLRAYMMSQVENPTPDFTWQVTLWCPQNNEEGYLLD